jgi:hypothetical protein
MDTKTPSIADSFQANSFDADINSATNITPLSGEQNGSFLSNVPWYAWLILVLVLAFFGFNIFVYLAKGTDDISNFFGPIIAKISSYFGVAAVDTAKQTASVAETGASAIASSSQGQSVASTIPQKDASQKTSLYNALNSSQQQEQSSQNNEKSEYTADDSHSTIQQTKSSNKAGWCYIGEDRGFRSCIKVNEGDTCMSGNIFPSEEICVNPNLRV